MKRTLRIALGSISQGKMSRLCFFVRRGCGVGRRRGLREGRGMGGWASIGDRGLIGWGGVGRRVDSREGVRGVVCLGREKDLCRLIDGWICMSRYKSWSEGLEKIKSRRVFESNRAQQ